MTPWQIAVVVALVGIFFFFFAVGGVRFVRGPDDDMGGNLAQISFFITGSLASWLLGVRTSIPLPNAIAAAALLAASLSLYLWALSTIRGQDFHIAWSADVPEALCDRGPYSRIRHPVYASYLLAFLAMAAAMPGWPTLAIFLFNAALFTHAALSDERAMANSALAEQYAAYRRRTGRFLPRR